MTRRLPWLVAAVLAIAALDTACERTEYVTLPGKPDTVIVQRPGHTDTIVVTHPETTFVQLPGRVDTQVVVRPETLVVVTHDTVIVHDTVTHYDTVRLSQVPAYLCIYTTFGDTLVAFNWDVTPYCDAAHLAQNAVPGTWNTLLNIDTLVMTLPSVQAALTRMANRPPSPLILPGYWTAHR